MKYLIPFLFLPFIAVSQSKYEKARLFQDELNESYRSAESPLTEDDKKSFKELPFFPVDTSWVIEAELKRTPEEPVFKMRTTTSRLAEYRCYGILTFEVDGKKHSLRVYQSMQLMNKEGYEDYLFLPFRDLTNGEESYGGGRYMNLRIPEGDRITLDFNQCYNPYCAYNDRYSCPVVPDENFLELKVTAGVMAHSEH
jgi:uncharacterized protein (DUF1684 family)